MSFFVHELDPIIVTIGPVRIGWYGFLFLCSFLLAYIFVKINYEKKGVKLLSDQYESFMINIMCGVMVGGRLGYVLFYNFSYYFENPLRILYVWEGGMSFHGGAIGVILVALFFCKKYKQDFFALADPAMPLVAVGLGLGRIANFINGELYGRVTDLPWAVIFINTDPEMLPRHPSQLYEALFEGFLMAVFLQIVLLKSNIKGLIFWLFIGGYGIVRFLIEYIRIPDDLPMYQNGLLFGFFSMGQVLSIVMIFSAIIGVSIAVRKRIH